jgi:16S rRNA (cytosine967-C5)-methyltransferase
MREIYSKINYSKALRSLVSEVIYEGKPLDKTIEIYFKSVPGITLSDKKELFQLFSFTIRYWITISEIFKKLFPSRKYDYCEIIRIQKALGTIAHKNTVKPEGYEKHVLEAYTNFENESLKESYPEWLYQCLFSEHGNNWLELARNLNREPVSTLRVNTLKTSLADLGSRMNQCGQVVSPVEDIPNALRLDKFIEVFRSEEFKSGLFEVQDAGSQKIAPFLEAEAGMRVIDACSGNGGKTLHLADLMQNKGRIIALDIFQHKLDTIKKRMKRAGVFNIETRLIDSSKVIKRLYNSADRLLLDVPCSGTGVLKRNPDIKYHLSPEALQNIKETQKQILEKYSLMLAVNGLMVYSTCSVLPSENQQQIRWFLENKQGEFELLDEKTISPLDGFDGFYMAKLKRISRK